jgi:hypothetical protein
LLEAQSDVLIIRGKKVLTFGSTFTTSQPRLTLRQPLSREGSVLSYPSPTVMSKSGSYSFGSSWNGLLMLLFCLSAAAQSSCIRGQDSTGQQVCLDPNRKPTLYTQDFGDCQGNSLINVTQFDGAYYADNTTVTWDLKGQTSVLNDTVMSKMIRIVHWPKLTGTSLHRCVCIRADQIRADGQSLHDQYLQVRFHVFRWNSLLTVVVYAHLMRVSQSKPTARS